MGEVIQSVQLSTCTVHVPYALMRNHQLSKLETTLPSFTITLAGDKPCGRLLRTLYEK